MGDCFKICGLLRKPELYYISLFSKIRCSLIYLSTYLKIWRHMWMLPKYFHMVVRNSSFRSEQYSLSSQLLNHLLTKGKVLKVSKNLINASFSPHIFSLLQIRSYFYNTITKINNSQAIFKKANPVTLNYFFQYL